MTRLVASPKPVRTGRYRYSKLRWRVLVHAFDFFGSLAMAIVRRFSPARPIDCPRRIILVQLDHLGDAVLSTPLLAELRSAYPGATIDVLASPSNHEVFDCDPHVNRVQVADRTWFERKPERWGLLTAVWELGRSLRQYKYDLGIDVRGDVLSVLVLTLGACRGGWDGRWVADRSCSRTWRRGFRGGTRFVRGWRSWEGWGLFRTSEQESR